MKTMSTADSPRVIMSGGMEFGNERTFKRMLQTYRHRLENFYRYDTLLPEEDLFDEEKFQLSIPRLIEYGGNKSYNNTVSMLENIAEYAVSGDFSIWMVDTGKLLKHNRIQPKNDKSATQAYIRGRELIAEDKQNEAYEELSRAIKTFDRHAQAYRHRGFINYRLRNYEDAIYDFTKSIKIYPHAAKPYLGRALVHLTLENKDEALSDLGLALKNSILHEPVNWTARRLRAQLLYDLKRYEEAAKDLRLFDMRDLPEDHPSHRYQQQMRDMYKEVKAMG